MASKKPVKKIEPIRVCQVEISDFETQLVAKCGDEFISRLCSLEVGQAFMNQRGVKAHTAVAELNDKA